MFLKENEKFNYDLIMGSRFIGTRRSVLHFWHMIGNKFITLLFNILNNTTFTDIYSCYFAFKKSLIDPSLLQSSGFEQHAEIICKVVKSGKKFYLVFIDWNRYEL